MFHALWVVYRPVECYKQCMPDKPFPVLDALIREVEEIAIGEPDLVTWVVRVIRTAIAREADPYLLAGSLIEGIAVTLISRIPAELQSDVGAAAIRLLHDRLKYFDIR